ncbi:MAG: lytic transglycosylase domain-containing protein, partial [Clostridia bacterium]|nr:lytic transglycosylase domain-containing protein [Clostridia bacterium]
MQNKALLAVASVVLIVTIALAVSVKIFYPIRYESEIETACKTYDVDKSLVTAIIKCESSFNEQAKSNKGAIGLMQLMPSSAKWCAQKLGIEYSDEMLYNPRYNINMGVYYLSYLLDKFDLNYAICAYNAGEGNVSKWLNGDGQIKFPETRAYL